MRPCTLVLYVYPHLEIYHELKKIQLTLSPTLELPDANSHLDISEIFRIFTFSVV